ncbi:hypothetical protein HDU98_009585 [Podochytrium sp. JEL0797]|nr:hypothetical protein HDU98_009585 [Podochytrium sp. JEL0797]
MQPRRRVAVTYKRKAGSSSSPGDSDALAFSPGLLHSSEDYAKVEAPLFGATETPASDDHDDIDAAASSSSSLLSSPSKARRIGRMLAKAAKPPLTQKPTPTAAIPPTHKQQMRHPQTLLDDNPTIPKQNPKTTTTLTYGKTRSFLQNSEDDDREDASPDRAASSRAGTVDIDEGLDSSTDDDDEEKKRELHSVHELRESGKATRFTDEVQYITSGLGIENPIGLRRASYLELAKKISVAQFLLKARAFDVLGRFCDFLDGEDQIIASISLFILLVMCQDRRNIHILANHERVIPFVSKTFRAKPDILVTLPRSKYEWTFALEVKNHIESSNLLGQHEISNFTLGLHCLEIFITSTPPTTPSLHPVLSDPEITTLMVNNFKSACFKASPAPGCKSETKRRHADHVSAEGEGTHELKDVKVHLGIVVRLVSEEGSKGVVKGVKGVWEGVVGLLAGLVKRLWDSRGEVDDSVVELAFLTIQFLIDVTAQDASICEAINKLGGDRLVCAMVLHSWRVVDAAAGVNSTKLPLSRVQEHCGILLASLALLVNLVRNDEGLRREFGALGIQSDCCSFSPGSCKCIKTNVLEDILTLFKSCVKNAESTVPKTASVIVCALIGCLVSGESRDRIRDVLRGSITFGEMADLLQEFATFHQNGGSAAVDGDDGGEGVEEAAVDAGILRQMDHLLQVADVLRGI